MTKEQRDSWISFLVELERVSFEHTCMQALLGVAEKHGAFIVWAGPGQHSTWRQEVAYLMTHESRQKSRAALTQLLLRVAEEFQDSELSRLLKAWPVKGPIQ